MGRRNGGQQWAPAMGLGEWGHLMGARDGRQTRWGVTGRAPASSQASPRPEPPAASSAGRRLHECLHRRLHGGPADGSQQNCARASGISLGESINRPMSCPGSKTSGRAGGPRAALEHRRAAGSRRHFPCFYSGQLTGARRPRAPSSSATGNPCSSPRIRWAVSPRAAGSDVSRCAPTKRTTPRADFRSGGHQECRRPALHGPPADGSSGRRSPGGLTSLAG